MPLYQMGIQPAQTLWPRCYLQVYLATTCSDPVPGGYYADVNIAPSSAHAHNAILGEFRSQAYVCIGDLPALLLPVGQSFEDVDLSTTLHTRPNCAHCCPYPCSCRGQAVVVDRGEHQALCGRQSSTAHQVGGLKGAMECMSVCP